MLILQIKSLKAHTKGFTKYSDLTIHEFFREILGCPNGCGGCLDVSDTDEDEEEEGDGLGSGVEGKGDDEDEVPCYKEEAEQERRRASGYKQLQTS
ncbi:hypothetical protein Hanom_Chr09g00831831 [Helianthus anomalus]